MRVPLCFAAAAFVALPAAFLQPAPAAGPVQPEAVTASGVLRGVEEGGVRSFRGIPYAAAPTGPLRWRAPQPLPPWSGVRGAEAYGKDCMQHRLPFDSTPSFQPMSEDCLYLNVWAPADAAGGAPVMVWIHGGGLVIGSGAAPVFDGSAFARKGVVLVTLNYRLGRFGFFAHPALSAARAGEPIGNYGLMDQIAALQWVQRNIAAFGGDPRNVTIFGQSSGGVSVAHLMSSPPARGLFARAIVQSGGGREHWARMDQAVDDGFGTHLAAPEAGLRFAREQGIAGGSDAAALAALRALPAKAVLGKVAFLGGDAATDPAPMIDGEVAPADTDEAFRSGSEAAVPLLIGTTDDELGALPGFIQRRNTAKLMPRFGQHAAALDAWYGPGKTRPEDLFDDAAFVEPARFLARHHLAGGAPVWLYRFGYVATAERSQHPGAEHASELPYVFGTLDLAPPYFTLSRALGAVVLSWFGGHSSARRVSSAEDYRMSGLVQDAWIAFARDGDPAAGAGAAWPRYTADNGALMQFTRAGAAAGPDPWRERLDAITASYPEAQR